MANDTGAMDSMARSYTKTMRRWKKFCEENSGNYANHTLYLVDSESKLLRFFRDYILALTTVKHVEPETDIGAIAGAESNGLSLGKDLNLAKLMRDAPDDHKGRKIISVPIRVESIKMARKAMIRIHHLQQERNEVRVPGPAAMKELDSLIKHHQEKLFEQSPRSSLTRSVDCVQRLVPPFRLHRLDGCAMAETQADKGGVDHKEVKKHVIEDVTDTINSEGWFQLKVLPGQVDGKKNIVPQTTYHAATKVFVQHSIAIGKKTHGGRRAGAVETHTLAIPQSDIKAGGRWTADRGRMESFYMPSLPSDFAMGMAGFLNKPFYLKQNNVNPPAQLQLTIFPWIKDIYDENNKYWKEQCMKGMIEVYDNAPRPMETSGEPLPGALSPINDGNESHINTGTFCTKEDAAKNDFLKLLLRCRRIILQDATYRLYHH
ncbi:hypothetical protein BG011_009773 [Mortierella polycephala]|uniref:Ndc10 domain-containing protein n=1 Tax=Mortierella polycephala TaxID=41804 RepID=A0A9P6QF28_9FUNG|nr:hypothetical protein BG011_009773 [Mortierella polycephala]